MNKGELVKAIAEKTKATQKASSDFVNAIIETISVELKKGKKVQLVGFGTFETRKRAARKGRNPQTGEEIKISASVLPAFKAGKQLKDSIK